jgi:hypothetical protein
VKRRHWLFSVVLGGLLLAPAALAQSGSTSGGGYLGTAGETQSGVGSGGNLGAASQGTLPFTGLDLALLVAGGLMLLLVGASVRRLTRSRA